MRNLNDIIVDDVFTRLGKIENSNNNENTESIPSGYSALDKYINGFHKSDLILISAFEKCWEDYEGKLSFALNLALNITKKTNKKCLFISICNASVQIVLKLLSIQTGIDLRYPWDLTKDEWIKILAAKSELDDSRLYIEDKVPITVSEIKQKAKELKGVDCIIKDYLQLMSIESKKENWYAEQNEIVQKLKSMAEELNIPIICCVNGYRRCEREEKRPNLTLFQKRVGDIVQYADMMLFVHREDYYHEEFCFEQPNEDDQEENHLHNTELIILKNRYGKSNVSVDLVFDDKSFRFLQLSKENE